MSKLPDGISQLRPVHAIAADYLASHRSRLSALDQKSIECALKSPYSIGQFQVETHRGKWCKEVGAAIDERLLYLHDTELRRFYFVLLDQLQLTERGNLLNTTPELFDRLFAVNVRAPFFLMQDASKLMIRDEIKGSIVNIGSASSRAGQPFIAPYCASKGALATLTRNSGFALMCNRIRVNQLDIGWMNSDHERKLQAEESGDPGFIDKQAATLPFGRLLEPDEVARAVLWLASDDSGMMTGSVIHFDQSVWGGYDGQAPAPSMALSE